MRVNLRLDFYERKFELNLCDIVQATAGLRALEGDASDKILQAVTTVLSFSISMVLAAILCLFYFTFVALNFMKFLR